MIILFLSSAWLLIITYSIFLQLQYIHSEVKPPIVLQEIITHRKAGKNNNQRWRNEVRVSGFSLRVPSLVQSESNVHNYYGYRCCWHTGPGGQSVHILPPFWHTHDWQVPVLHLQHLVIDIFNPGCLISSSSRSTIGTNLVGTQRPAWEAVCAYPFSGPSGTHTIGRCQFCICM